MQTTRAQAVIIGGGPAGLTAALYLARDQADAIVLEKEQPGGQVIATERVENYPGFPDGVSGPELMTRLTEQVRRFGARIIPESEVTAIEPAGDMRRVKVRGQAYEAPYVIIASGGDYRRLDVPGGDKLTGRGVSYCAICDAAFYQGKTIAVIGGGAAAVDEGCFLAKFAEHIFLIQRGDRLHAEKLAVERLRQSGKVEFLMEHEVKSILGEEQVTGVELLDHRNNATRQLPLQGVFVFIGRVPNSAFVRNHLICDNEGFIITSSCSVETTRKNIFAIGDVRAGSRAQITTAVGEGAIAAFLIRERLEAARRRQSQP